MVKKVRINLAWNIFTQWLPISNHIDIAISKHFSVSVEVERTFHRLMLRDIAANTQQFYKLS